MFLCPTLSMPLSYSPIVLYIKPIQHPATSCIIMSSWYFTTHTHTTHYIIHTHTHHTLYHTHHIHTTHTSHTHYTIHTTYAPHTIPYNNTFQDPQLSATTNTATRLLSDQWALSLAQRIGVLRMGGFLHGCFQAIENTPPGDTFDYTAAT